MSNDAQIGAMIEAGLQDWQIIQQDVSGFATIPLYGRWQAAEAAADQPCVVEVRVVAGDTGVAVSRALDWQAATTAADGRWQMTLRVPAGGAGKGILWYQGESDAGPGLVDNYAERFQAAVAAWRTALQQPDLPILTVQLNRYYQPPDTVPTTFAEMARAWSLLREVQRQLAHMMTQMAVVPTLDLALSDNIHIGAGANLVLGERLARAALGMVYGQPVAYRAPDLYRARLIEKLVIELSFANVFDRLDNVDRAANCFKVEDSAGDVPITGVRYPLNHTVQLCLARPLFGAAVVHGAYGYNPALAPVDMDRVMPMLAFGQVLIEVTPPQAKLT